MIDGDKSKEQLIEELAEMRRRVAEVEASEGRLKHALEALARTEREKDAVLNGMKDVIIEYVDPDMRIIWSNLAMSAYWDIPPGDLVGRYCYELVQNLQEPCPNCTAVKALQTGKPYEGEVTLPDGHAFMVCSNPVKDDGGQIVGVVHSSIDITERKRAEEAVRKSEERFRMLFNKADDGIALHGITEDGLPGRMLEANDALCERLGYSREELLQLSVIESIDDPEHGPEVARKAVEKLHEDGHALFEQLHVAKDGRKIPVEIHAHMFELGGQPTILAVTRDITKRRQTEETLRTQAAVLESMAEGVNVADENGVILFTNPAFDAIFGYSQEGLVGKNVTMLNDLAPEENARFVAEVIEQLASEGAYTGEVSNRRKDGTRFITRVAIRSVRLPDRKQCWVAVQEDITERKQAEKALRESEERFRLLLDASNAGIAFFDGGANLRVINQFAAEVLGGEPEDFIGKNLRDMMPAEESGWRLEMLQRVVETGKAETVEEKLGGWEFVTDVHPVKDASGSTIGVQITARDVTEQRQAEAQLQQAQKMEAIGTLAGGVAHDVNNVLGAIMALASVIESEVEPGVPWRQDIEEILGACRRGRDLTRNLLGFARKGKYIKEPVSLNRIAKEVKGLLKRTIPKKIAIKTVLGKGLAHVEGDPGQMTHALMNLGLNAVEAMHGKGTLTISTDNAELGETEIGAHPDMTPGRYVRLEVTDTGVGMDEETRDRAFEPFFTTKPTGHGTGLGLSMVFGTITNHGGVVTLDSEPGEGTTVTILLPAILLPAIEADEGEPTTEWETLTPVPAGSTVLLVDDEEMIRTSGKRMLEKLGCEVVLAGDGKEAVEICRERKGDFGLVVLDLVMPVMDGPEAFEELRREHPDLRILLSSGYAKEDKAEGLLVEGAVGFIQKPFDMKALSAEIKRVLKG